MKIVVPVKLVPDLVEELVVDESGVSLDPMEVVLCLNEFDDHAIEQAILLKEKEGGQVTVIAPGLDEADDLLFNAAAKGVDKLLRLGGDFDDRMDNNAYARMLAPLLRDLQPDLILTGVQAHNDLDGQLGPLLAEYLDFPYIGYVAGISHENGQVEIIKEYPAGLTASYLIKLPAVIGIQASEQPPRYVAFSRVRQAMQTAVIEDIASIDPPERLEPVVSRLYPPEGGQRAEMIEGEPDEIAARLVAILAERGYLQKVP
jgi:electron transfer flavoprotein beta subunit